MLLPTSLCYCLPVLLLSARATAYLTVLLPACAASVSVITPQEAAFTRALCVLLFNKMGIGRWGGGLAGCRAGWVCTMVTWPRVLPPRSLGHMYFHHAHVAACTSTTLTWPHIPPTMLTWPHVLPPRSKVRLHTGIFCLGRQGEAFIALNMKRVCLWCAHRMLMMCTSVLHHVVLMDCTHGGGPDAWWGS